MLVRLGPLVDHHTDTLEDCQLLSQRFPAYLTSPGLRESFKRWSDEVVDRKLESVRELPVEALDVLVALLEARHEDSQWMSTR